MRFGFYEEICGALSKIAFRMGRILFFVKGGKITSERFPRSGVESRREHGDDACLSFQKEPRFRLLGLGAERRGGVISGQKKKEKGCSMQN